MASFKDLLTRISEGERVLVFVYSRINGREKRKGTIWYPVSPARES